MGWSRDLGIVAAEDVERVLLDVTAAATGRLTDAEEARRTVLRTALGNGESISAEEITELSKLNGAARRASMSPEEAAAIAPAAITAAAGVRAMGGRAHVSVGGSSRLEEQPEAPIKGARQTSITVTISVVTGAAQTEPVKPQPLREVAPQDPWLTGESRIPAEPEAAQ